MAKHSAGIMLYKQKGSAVEVLLGHPGGPFWARKDEHAWSVPKGLFEDGEAPIEAAKREFAEEIGQPVPEGKLRPLGEAKMSSGKVVHIWAVEADMDVSRITSNMATIEWPPKSGQTIEIPELDRADWFDLATAQRKLVKGQVVFIDRLAALLGADMPKYADKPAQSSLF
jgi:predicted NUDIX family NTP pyrophosphohydrolase